MDHKLWITTLRSIKMANQNWAISKNPNREPGILRLQPAMEPHQTIWNMCIAPAVSIKISPLKYEGVPQIIHLRLAFSIQKHLFWGTQITPMTSWKPPSETPLTRPCILIGQGLLHQKSPLGLVSTRGQWRSTRGFSGTVVPYFQTSPDLCWSNSQCLWLRHHHSFIGKMMITGFVPRGSRMCQEIEGLTCFEHLFRMVS